MKPQMQKIEYENYTEVSKIYDDARTTPAYSHIKSHLAKLTPHAVILDVGCGTGNYLEQIALDFPGTSLYGIDLNEGMLEQARIKTRKYSNVKKLLNESAQEIPFGDSYFDLILITQTLHHMGEDKHREEFFKEARRVLKRGGRMIVNHSTPLQVNYWWFVYLCPNALEKSRSANRSNDIYVSMAERHGFRSVEIELIKKPLIREDLFEDYGFFRNKDSLTCQSSLSRADDDEKGFFIDIVKDLHDRDHGKCFIGVFKKMMEKVGNSTNLVFEKV